MKRKRVGLVGAGLAVVLFATSAVAMASSGVTVCVPGAEGKPVLTPRGGACSSGYALAQLPPAGRGVRVQSEGTRGRESTRGGEASGRGESPEAAGAKSELTPAEVDLLKRLLPHVKFVAAGVDRKPTIVLSRVNLQIVNGLGGTLSTNGEGNVVIGYDENGEEHPQTGSHNLILGAEQTFTSFAGIVAGAENKIAAPFAVVLGGPQNVAGGEFSAVTGGSFNNASAAYASVAGGSFNTAGGLSSSVSGGENNHASGGASWVGSGRFNRAEGYFSSVFGGRELSATGEYEAIP